MSHELVAYLMQSDGQIIAMPTDDLQVILDQLTPPGQLQEQNLSDDHQVIAEFLQMLKYVMQTCKTLSPES
jgi:hypothetical protein